MRIIVYGFSLLLRIVLHLIDPTIRWQCARQPGPGDSQRRQHGLLHVNLVGLLFSVSLQAQVPADYEGFGAVTRGALDAPDGYTIYQG